MPRIRPQEFEKLPLRVHEFLAGVTLHDVWAVDLLRMRPGITLDEFLRAAGGVPFKPSLAARMLLKIRFAVGRLFDWDREPETSASNAFATRLSADDRSKSLAPPGKREGPFRIVYRFENEQRDLERGLRRNSVILQICRGADNRIRAMMASPFNAGSSAVLRPTGIARYFGAAFLVVWLVGWAIGEFLALGFFVMLIRSVAGSAVGLSWPIPGGQWIAGGAAGFVLLFLVLWLSLWTCGGLAAINELLRSLAGEDRVSADSTGVQLVRRAGPFECVRTFERSVIRRVRIRRHDKAAVVDTTSGTEVLTTFGTYDERQTLTEWMRRQLALPEQDARVETGEAPPGWNMTVDGNMVRLNQLDRSTRRTGAVISWFIVALMALIWIGSTKTETISSSAIAFALTLLAASWAAWVTWSSREWLVQYGQLTSYRRFAFWEWERRFSSARLEVVVSTDSDNDDHYKLKVIDELGPRTIASELNDDADIVHLARWLEERTGFPLTISPAAQPRPKFNHAQSSRPNA